MPTTADRVLRDHVRYTGDGKPNEPVGKPLPVGDPASGVHNPTKADLRDALNEVTTLADTAELGMPWIDTLASFTANASISYGTGNNKVAVGDYIRTREEGLSLKVLASGAATYNMINANGVKANIVSRATTMPSGIGDQFSSAKYDLIGGVLRQNSADRTQWNFLNDSAHVPVGFDPSRPLLASDGTTNLAPRAAGQSLLFFFKHTTDRRVLNVADDGYYDRVSAVNAWADETLSKDWGISLGAKVTRSGLLVYGSMHKTRHMRIYYSGSQFVITDDSLQPFGSASVTATYAVESVTSTAGNTRNIGVLTVTHPWLPGSTLIISPDARQGLPDYVFNAVQYQVVSDTQFKVAFMDSPTTYYAGAVSRAMCFRATRVYDGPASFDGTGGWDNIPWDEGDTGNIWVHGFMRREAPL